MHDGIIKDLEVRIKVALKEYEQHKHEFNQGHKDHFLKVSLDLLKEVLETCEVRK